MTRYKPSVVRRPPRPLRSPSYPDASQLKVTLLESHVLNLGMTSMAKSDIWTAAVLLTIWRKKRIELGWGIPLNGLVFGWINANIEAVHDTHPERPVGHPHERMDVRYGEFALQQAQHIGCVAHRRLSRQAYDRIL